ncbi:hypothetical protein A5N78_04680 [Prescottella equi]|nr:hypothetical protein A5N78_04680 [Prescottella equi]ORM17787.1 hypothetical protein A5N70_11255 [Prescottella equi]
MGGSAADILAELTKVKQRQDFEKRTRIALMLKGRAAGVPNTRMAEALGVSETAVRAMLKRANGGN